MRVTLEGSEGDIMTEGNFVTEADLTAKLKDALDAQATVAAEAVRAAREEVASLRAELQTLRSAQPSPMLPALAPNSMMFLSGLSDSLKKFVIPDFEGSYTSTVSTMELWEKHYPLLTDDVKLHAIMQQIPREHYEQWSEQMQNCLDATTPEEPAWKLMLNLMRAFYSQADRELEGVFKLKSLAQGNRSVEQLWTQFQNTYRDVPTDAETRKKYDFLACLDSDLRKLVRATTELKDKTLQEVVTQAKRLEDRSGDKSKNKGNPSGSRNQAGNQPRQAQGSASTSHTAAGKQYPQTATDKALVAGKLEKFEGYAPATVAALHAKLDASNPDRKKLDGFIKLNKLCYKCRDQGHVADDCPQK